MLCVEQIAEASCYCCLLHRKHWQHPVGYFLSLVPSLPVCAGLCCGVCMWACSFSLFPHFLSLPHSSSLSLSLNLSFSLSIPFICRRTWLGRLAVLVWLSSVLPFGLQLHSETVSWLHRKKASAIVFCAVQARLRLPILGVNTPAGLLAFPLFCCQSSWNLLGRIVSRPSGSKML